MKIQTHHMSRMSVAFVSILTAFLLYVPLFLSSQGNQAIAQYGPPNVYISIVPGASTKSTDAFSPSPTQVSIGTTVIWTNKDSALHTVESGVNATPDGKFGVQSDGQTPILLPPGKTLSYTTTTEGTFPYFCSLHPAMVGTLQVNSSPSESVPVSTSISVFTNKPSYSLGESVTLSGTATSANSANYITVTIFDSKGGIFKVDQFHPNADGSFVYGFPLSGNGAASGEWSVSAAYADSKATTHFSVQGSATSATFPFKITGSQTTDISGNPINIIHAGSAVMVNLSATNIQSGQENMIIILQIENSEGTTEFLSWQSSSVAGGQSMTGGFGWTPDNQGTYKIKALVWQSIGNPLPLADPFISTLSVV